jgi:glycosyltransferase involved in cell wall biosynthesis
MVKPHILFVYKQFPAPAVGHAGGESLFRLMQGLHQLGYRVSLVAKITEEEKRHLPEVESICDHIYTTPHFRCLPGPKIKTLPQSYLALRKLTRQAIEELHPDLLHVETTQTALTLLGLARPPASYRTQDVNWFMYEQRLYRTRGIKRMPIYMARVFFRLLETYLYQHYDIIVAISKGDQRLIQALNIDKSILMVSLGTAMASEISHHQSSSEMNLVFVGDLSRKLNVEGIMWFLDNVWQTILTAYPTVKLYIVGRQPPPELQARADGVHVITTGYVKNLALWYQKATVFISPLLVSGGLLQKILDAMWLGVPVVATSVCNNGLGAKPGEEILTADDPQSFADAVCQLLANPVLYQQLSARGQAFVYRHYDIEPSLAQWAQALMDVDQQRPISCKESSPGC